MCCRKVKAKCCFCCGKASPTDDEEDSKSLESDKNEKQESLINKDFQQFDDLELEQASKKDD